MDWKKLEEAIPTEEWIGKFKTIVRTLRETISNEKLYQSIFQTTLVVARSTSWVGERSPVEYISDVNRRRQQLALSRNCPDRVFLH